MKLLGRMVLVGYCLGLGYWLYTNFFSQAISANTRVNQIKTGMTRQQVTALLSNPDSVYWQRHSPTDSSLVMEYTSQEAANTLRVVLYHDSVRSMTLSRDNQKRPSEK